MRPDIPENGRFEEASEEPLQCVCIACTVYGYWLTSPSLRSGPGRRPRSIRGTRRGTDEEEERDSDLTSIDGGGDDDDDYRPVVISAPGTTRELVSRLRRERRRTIRYVAGDSTEESDTGVESGWLQTSNVRHTVESPICGEDGLAEI